MNLVGRSGLRLVAGISGPSSGGLDRTVTLGPQTPVLVAPGAAGQWSKSPSFEGAQNSRAVNGYLICPLAAGPQPRRSARRTPAGSVLTLPSENSWRARRRGEPTPE